MRWFAVPFEIARRGDSQDWRLDQLARDERRETGLAETDGEIDAFRDQMDMLEEHLSKGHQYFSGEQFGTAGIVLGPNVHRWFHMPVERARRPPLERWYSAIASRSAAKPSLPVPIS